LTRQYQLRCLTSDRWKRIKPGLILLVGDELAAVGAIAAPFVQDLYRG